MDIVGNVGEGLRDHKAMLYLKHFMSDGYCIQQLQWQFPTKPSPMLPLVHVARRATWINFLCFLPQTV